MPRLTKVVALLLVALWLPATLHCQLETLGLDEFFACADQAEHTDRGECTGDGCQVLESGQIMLSKTKVESAVLPALACVGHLGLSPVGLPTPAPEFFASRQDETLPLQRTWQFARRAAWPARAPDVLNA